MIKLGTVKRLPMLNAEVSKFEYPLGRLIDGMPGVTFISKSDSVFSICDGIANAVFDLGTGFAMTIRNNDLFYSYANLSKSFIQKGDTVKKGSLIGLANKDFENGYNLFFIVSNKKGVQMVEEKVWGLLQDE